jgi:hypothetical protein
MLDDICSLLTKDSKASRAWKEELLVNCVTYRVLFQAATLLLPVSLPSHPSAIIDREFIEDHVMLYQSPVDMTQMVSLSGIRGTFQKYESEKGSTFLGMNDLLVSAM